MTVRGLLELERSRDQEEERKAPEVKVGFFNLTKKEENGERTQD